MTFDQFKDRLPEESKSSAGKQVLRTWYYIHRYINAHGQADRYDEGLSSYLGDNIKWISEQTIQRHLKRMTDVGLLISHKVVVRYTPMGKAMLPFGTIWSDTPPAGVHNCYTLPGLKPVFEKKK